MLKKTIFKLLTLSILLSNFNGLAQENKTLKLNVELDLIQPILGGYGATIGIENKHWGAGLMGFNTKLSTSSRDFLMKGAEDFHVQNWGIEIYANYFINPEHKGLNFGALISLDGFEMNSNTFSKETIIGVYAVPRIGYRWIPSRKIDWLYLQPSIATPILIWDDFSKIETAVVTPSRVIILPMLTLGFKFPLQ